MAVDFIDLVSKLTDADRAVAQFRLRSVSPDAGKYGRESEPIAEYLSAEAEWKACAFFQKVLLETRVAFGSAESRHVEEVERALPLFDPLNAALLEERVTKHDQLAVLEELGRHISLETKALLHPGTTSYDILDTVRSYLLRECWNTVMREKVSEVIESLCDLSPLYQQVLQVGRTHLQKTSPIPFGTTLAGYAARLAKRVEVCDRAFSSLKGKVSGIVGTGASVDFVR